MFVFPRNGACIQIRDNLSRPEYLNSVPMNNHGRMYHLTVQWCTRARNVVCPHLSMLFWPHDMDHEPSNGSSILFILMYDRMMGVWLVFECMHPCSIMIHMHPEMPASPLSLPIARRVGEYTLVNGLFQYGECIFFPWPQRPFLWGRENSLLL